MNNVRPTDARWDLSNKHSCDEQQMPKVQPTRDIESPVQLDSNMPPFPLKWHVTARIKCTHDALGHQLEE